MVTLPINESIRKLLNTGNPQLIIISNLDNCNVTLQMILDKTNIHFYLDINSSEIYLFDRSILRCLESDVELNYDLKSKIKHTINDLRNNLSQIFSQI